MKAHFLGQRDPAQMLHPRSQPPMFKGNPILIQPPLGNCLQATSQGVKVEIPIY